jgi:hypothetical protein
MRLLLSKLHSKSSLFKCRWYSSATHKYDAVVLEASETADGPLLPDLPMSLSGSLEIMERQLQHSKFKGKEGEIRLYYFWLLPSY